MTKTVMMPIYFDIQESCWYNSTSKYLVIPTRVYYLHIGLPCLTCASRGPRGTFALKMKQGLRWTWKLQQCTNWNVNLQIWKLAKASNIKNWSIQLVLPAGLSSRPAMLQSCKVACCKIAILQSCKFTKLQCCNVAMLQCCNVERFKG